METKPKRKVCVVLVDRANYGRLKPVLHEITQRPELQLQLVAAGTMVLERFGNPVQNVKNDGFHVDGEIYIELEGSTPATMAKSLGFAVVEFASEFQRLKPDVVMLIGDRYEALAAALAAAYMNICIVHIQGGEVSGSIDESARHAITKLAHYHFPARSFGRLSGAHGRSRRDPILGVGCPSSDIARVLVPIDYLGVDQRHRQRGGHRSREAFSAGRVSSHDHLYGGERKQVEEILAALSKLQMQTSCSGRTSTPARTISAKPFGCSATAKRRTGCAPSPIFLRSIISTCSRASPAPSAIPAALFATPAISERPWCWWATGRKAARPMSTSLTWTPVATRNFPRRSKAAQTRGLRPSTLYGDGLVAGRIADGLVALEPYVQKAPALYLRRGSEDSA